MNTVKQKKAWDEETTLYFDSVKRLALLALAFQVVLLKVKQILEQLRRRKLDCECANVRKHFPLPTQPLYLSYHSAVSMLQQVQSCICTISGSWSSWWVPGEGGEVPFPLGAGQEGAQALPLLLRTKCLNHSIQKEASQLTQVHSAWEWSPRVRLKPLNNSPKIAAELKNEPSMCWCGVPAIYGSGDGWLRGVWAWEVALY